ncbi:MAG: glutamine-hydrolyzing carbamoyl-phosphate synthase small subunit [Deltaproteobacteria bacterium]|nr:glutamine-hydrolyzing carbamoyl-phosphate synthase small subunit [Deltaproteobacteria bacterium]
MALGLRPGVLALKDGTVLRGRAFGAAGSSDGEVVFNTSLTGYPEILTDPSYAGQVVTLTAAQVGNYGITEADLEAARPAARGLVIRALPEVVSSWRAERSLEDYLSAHGIPGLCDVDTRALVRHLRTAGAQPGLLWSGHPGQAPDVDALVARAATLPTMHGQDWVTRVTTPTAHAFAEPVAPLAGEPPVFPVLPRPQVRPHVVAFDYGAKRNILRLLVSAGFRVTVVPAATSAQDVLAQRPDGVFLSNGPGDPAACTDMVAEVGRLLGKLPVFGICLGHQLMALALGARTYKLRFGHRGGNQPVQDLATGRVHVTSQNHGFAVDPAGLPPGLSVSEVNLSDGTVEGLRAPGHRAFSVQYHPEAAPGPHDTRHHFLAFRRMVLGLEPEEGLPS